jgi:hypothetical protein
MNADELSTLLAAIAGLLLSIVAEYVPAYQQLEDRYKRLVMGLALVLVSASMYGLSCAGWLVLLLDVDLVSCDQAGVVALVKAFLAALITNQTTHSLLFRGRPKD